MYSHKYVRLTSNNPGNMAFAGLILRQHDVAGAEAPDSPISTLNLPFSRKRYNVLPARSSMPVNYTLRRDAMDNDASGGLERGFVGPLTRLK